MYYRHDLILQVRQRLLELLANADDEAWSSQVVCHPSTDCPSGKMRWAVEIEEPDERPSSTPNTHPRVLLVNAGKDLAELYTMYLEQAGCKVESVFRDDEAMQQCCESGPYDVVMLADFRFMGLVRLVRERNPKQPIALVATCGATGSRFRYRIPILRVPFPRYELVRLVQSAIKPEARVLLVAGDPDDSRWKDRRLAYRHIDLWHLVWHHPISFEVELVSGGDEALQRYREHGPYDIVLSGLHIAGIDGSDLAQAIRRENSAQRIAIITEERSGAVRRSIQQKLPDTPVLREEDLFETMRKLHRTGQWPEGEAQALLASVNATVAQKQSKAAKSTKRKQARR
jgi:CheY-like chemotaxis protein